MLLPLLSTEIVDSKFPLSREASFVTLYTFDIDMLKSGQNNPTPIKHIYNESANLNGS